MGAAQGVQRRAVVCIVVLAQQQGVHQGVGQRSDADLQRAAVTYQGAGVQAEGELGHPHRLARQSEQGVAAGRVVEQQVEEVGRDLGVVANIGQVRMHHADHQRPRQAGAGHGVEQVLRHIGVASQAEALAPGLLTPRHELHHHVDADGGEVTRYVGVIEAGVLALGGIVVQQRSRLQIELADLDVGRQPAAAARLDVVEVRIVRAEMAPREGADEALLQRTGRRWPRQ